METFLLSSRDLGPTTTDKILRFLRILERGGIDLDHPSRSSYDLFIAKRKRAGRDGPGTRHYARAMKHLLAFHRTSWPDFRLPRAAVARRRVLPDAIVAKLLELGEDLHDDDDVATARSVFRMNFYTGLRAPSELVDLDVDDVDLELAELRVWSEKLDVYDTVHLFPWVVDALRDYLEVRARVAAATSSRDRALFLNPHTGRRFTVNGFRMWISRHGRRVHKRFRPSDMRHWSATWILRETKGNLEVAQLHLRHRAIATTKTYDHVTREDKLRFLMAADVRPLHS